MTVTEALELARLQGVEVTLDGDDLVLKAEAAPPPGLLAILGRGKWDIVAALRLREAEERRRIVQWVNDHFTSSPPGVCAHCGDGPRSRGPVRPAVRRKRSGRGARLMSFSVDSAAGGRSAQCARAWDPSNGGDRAAVKLNDRSTMMRRRTGKTNDIPPPDLRRMPHKRRPALPDAKKGGHSRDSASGPRTAPTGLQ